MTVVPWTRRTVRLVLSGALVASAAGLAPAVVTAASAATAAKTVKVDFTAQSSAPASGYVKDYGQSYGARTGTSQGSGLSYGWVKDGTETPLSLIGNARDRGASSSSDVRLRGFVHMQLPSNTSGVHGTGSWELGVPDGYYTVTVVLGDPTATDSSHAINIESQNGVAAFVPDASKMAVTATRTVRVTDGRLTLSPKSGTNTKIDYVVVVPDTDGAEHPSVRSVTPGNLVGGVSTTSSVVADLSLAGGGVQESSLPGAVTLTNLSTGKDVAGSAVTSGGGDTINFSPSATLPANTEFRFEVRPTATDVNGKTFLPYSTVFWTGAQQQASSIAFDKTVGVATGDMFTSVVKGPDGKLYAGSIAGAIYRWTIKSDGTLTGEQKITTVQQHSTAVKDPYNPGMRTVLGLAFDPKSTPANPILWISDDAPFVGTPDVPDFTGRIAKLSGPDLGTYTTEVYGLPRSVKDHETNSLAFGPDGALYFTQGANNAMGAPDDQWGDRSEHLLNAAVLRLDTSKLSAGTALDVKTVDAGGPYDPYASGAALTIYASGVRNAFDLVWHSNGHLYTPTNGSAAAGNTPATPSTLPASCSSRRVDKAANGAYTGPDVPGITNNPTAETDYVFDVKKGRYYGHPNPSRCEYVLAGGNPTSGSDEFETSAYPVGVKPDRNLDLADMYDAGLHASADGAIEYKGSAFGGALAGKLLVVRYSDGQDIERFDVAADGGLSNRSYGDISGMTGFDQPLDLAEDDSTGDLYVTELGASRITLLKPRVAGSPAKVAVTGQVVESGVIDKGAGTGQDVTIANTGGSALTVSSLSFSGTWAGQFTITNKPTLPFTIPAGSSRTVSVAFDPTDAGPKGADLVVKSSDTSNPSTTLQVRGLGTRGEGGTNEPSLQWILDTWQIKVDVGDPNASDNAMPTTNPLGDEVSLQKMTKLDDDSPVTVTPLAVYGPTSKDPAVTFGSYTAGQSGQRTARFSVPASSAQTVAVKTSSGSTTFDPGSAAFGLYTWWPAFSDRQDFSEDALNTWDTVRHHMRAYPLPDGSGGTVAGSYVVAFEESTSGQDYQDLVAVVTNVKPVSTGSTAPAASKITVSNLDGVPFSDRLVMYRIGTPKTDPPNLVHDQVTVRITNSGTASTSVTGLPVTGPFELSPKVTTPFTLAAGASKDVTVLFNAGRGTVRTGTLGIQTGSGTTSVQLAGIWQQYSERDTEPTLAQVSEVFGYTTNIPANVDQNGAYTAQGDEVLSAYWKRLSTGSPVKVVQLAALHTHPNTATLYTYVKGSSSTTSLFKINGDSAQSLLPWISGSTTKIAQASFTPSSSTFGFKVDGEWSDPTKNDQSKDRSNGCTASQCGSHVRFWPVKDRSGKTVAGEYLMGMDYSGINYDYQDNVYLISNITPAS